MRYFLVIVLLSSAWVFSSCSVGRVLDDKAYVYVDGRRDIVFNSQSSKYLNSSNSDEYYLTFMREFDAALKVYNIELLSTNNLKQENLYISIAKPFEMSETYSVENIYSDSLSLIPETYKITKCGVNYDFDLYKSGSQGKEHLKGINVFCSDEEKLNTKRTFFQILFGANKNRTEFTYRELSSNVCDDLMRKTARRSAAKISKTISKDKKY